MRYTSEIVMHPTDIDRRFFYATKRFAARYDNTIGWVAPLYSILHDTILRLVAEDIRGRARKPYYILDIGCGTGAESLSILRKHKNVRLVALDQSGAMLEELRKNLAGQGVSESRVEFVEADFLGVLADPKALKSYLPPTHRRRGFDAVLSAFTFHHFTLKDKQEAYQRAFDCLTPGGLCLNGDLFDYESESRIMTKFALEFDIDWIHQHFTRAAQSEKNDERRAELLRMREDWKRHYFVDNTCHSASRQMEMLRSIGFRQVATPFRYFQVGLLWAQR